MPAFSSATAEEKARNGLRKSYLPSPPVWSLASERPVQGNRTARFTTAEPHCRWPATNSANRKHRDVQGPKTAPDLCSSPKSAFFVEEIRKRQTYEPEQTDFPERPGQGARRIRPHGVEGFEGQSRNQPRALRQGQATGPRDELPAQSLRHEPKEEHAAHHRRHRPRHRDPLLLLHPERHRGHGRGQRILCHHHHLARIL